jgi:AraC family transcriptional activator of pobA
MLAAHRHARLHQVLLVESGGGRATLDGCMRALRPMDVVNVAVGDVHGFSFVPGTQGWVLTLAAEILDEALLASERLRGMLSSSTVVRGTPQIRSTMKQIFVEYAGRNFVPHPSCLVGDADRPCRPPAGGEQAGERRCQRTTRWGSCETVHIC